MQLLRSTVGVPFRRNLNTFRSGYFSLNLQGTHDCRTRPHYWTPSRGLQAHELCKAQDVPVWLEDGRLVNSIYQESGLKLASVQNHRQAVPFQIN